MIIAIEGCDQLGKTTVAKHLAEKLGWTYQKFPNEDLDSGKMIRSILNRDFLFNPCKFQMLQNQNKLETLLNLDLKKNYIFDRFTLSEIVYGIANGLDEEFVRNLADGLPLPDPDFTIVFFGHPYGEDTDIYSSNDFQFKVSRLFTYEKIKRGYVGVYVNGQSREELFYEVLMKLPEGIL